MALREIDDRETLHQYLSKDVVGCAFHLGYLDDSFRPWTRWWGIFDDETGGLDLILVLYEGLSVPVVMTIGSGLLMEELLVQLHPQLPAHFYCQVEHDHLPVLESRYEVDNLRLSLRMALHRDEFESSQEDPWVVRLGHKDTTPIVELFKHAPDHLFEPFQLDSGYFFGIYDQAGGSLISVSGTQAFSRTYDVALLGHIVTHPKFRRLGLAKRVLARQLEELFEQVNLVALNVPEDNVAAQHTYLSHLFEPHRYFWEGMVRLKF